MGDREVFGRDDELVAVAEFVREATAWPAVFVIVGEAGIGKTTLWREAVACAEPPAWRVLCCSPAEAETSLSFAGMADLLGDVLADVLPALPAPQAAALEVALRRVEPEQPPDQLAVRSGFLNALRVLSKGSAVVVAVDDVQWLDAPSRLALAFALRRLRDERVAFVVTRRGAVTDELPLGLDRAQPALRVERLEVGPLSLGAVHGLLRSRLDSSFPRPMLRKIHEVSSGNPFCALELGRELLRHGLELTPEKPLPLPSSLQSLVRGRLECLSAPTREVLLGASALAEATIGVLEKAYTRQRVRAALEEAMASGIVTIEPQGVHFSHRCLLPPATRRPQWIAASRPISSSHGLSQIPRNVLVTWPSRRRALTRRSRQHSRTRLDTRPPVERRRRVRSSRSSRSHIRPPNRVPLWFADNFRPVTTTSRPATPGVHAAGSRQRSSWPRPAPSGQTLSSVSPIRKTTRAPPRSSRSKHWRSHSATLRGLCGSTACWRMPTRPTARAGGLRTRGRRSSSRSWSATAS